MPRDLRRTPVPPPPPAATVAHEFLPPPLGSPPLPRGEFAMTPYIRAQLNALGWTEGDPIPGDLSELLAEARKAINAEQAVALPPAAKDPSFRPSIPDVIQLADLPPAKQAEMRKKFDDAKKQMAQMSEDAARQQSMVVPGARPEVNAAIQQLAKTPGIRTKSVPAADQTQPGVFFQNDAPADEPAQPAPPQPAAPPAHNHPPDAPLAAGTGAINTCPRCEWNMKIPYHVDVSEEDKIAWTASQLSAGRTRFYKVYQFGGGHIKATFRTLTVAESKMVLLQTRYDGQQGDVVSQMEYVSQMMEYRLALSLHDVSVDGVPLMEPQCELNEIKWDKPKPGDPPATPLVAIRDYMNESIASESLRQSLARKLRLFENIVDKLSALDDNEDF